MQREQTPPIWRPTMQVGQLRQSPSRLRNYTYVGVVHGEGPFWLTTHWPLAWTTLLVSPGSQLGLEEDGAGHFGLRYVPSGIMLLPMYRSPEKASWGLDWYYAELDCGLWGIAIGLAPFHTEETAFVLYGFSNMHHYSTCWSHTGIRVQSSINKTIMCINNNVGWRLTPL